MMAAGVEKIEAELISWNIKGVRPPQLFPFPIWEKKSRALKLKTGLATEFEVSANRDTAHISRN